MDDQTFPLLCDGPGPHDPSDGVLGETSVEGASGMRCSAPACRPVLPAAPDEIDIAALKATVAKATTVPQLRVVMMAYLDAVAVQQSQP